MAVLEDYNKVRTMGGYMITTNCRIRQYVEMKNYLIIQTFPKSGDNEYGIEDSSIRCYDEYGNLKWVFSLGVTGIGKADENTVTLFDGEYLHYLDVATGIEDKNKMQFLK
jgi:hypothetical protein